MEAIQKRTPKLELAVVVGASALLDRYGSAVNTIEKRTASWRQRVCTC